MENRNNAEKKSDVLVGYAGISGCALGSMLIFSKVKDLPVRKEHEREYTYKDDDELDDYYDSL